MTEIPQTERAIQLIGPDAMVIMDHGQSEMTVRFLRARSN